MLNIAPSRALERRSRDVIKGALLIILVGGFLAIIGIALFVISLSVPSNPAYNLYDTIRRALVAGGGTLAVVGLLVGLRALTWKTDNSVAQMTGDELAKYLDKRYIYIRNVSKRAIGYVDALLVGPPGLLVFRIVDREGVYFNDGARWLRQRDKGEWQPLRWNPTQEVVDDIQKIRAYLAERQLGDVPVYGVIVFTKPTPDSVQVTMQKPVVPILYLHELSYGLSDSYFAKDRISASVIEQLVRLFYSA